MNKKEKKGLNNNVLIWIIAGLVFILLLTIGVMWFFLWNKLWWNDNTWKVNYDNLTLTIITDSRDEITPVDKIIDELKTIPSIKNAQIEEMEFSDKGVKELLKKAEIKFLPAFIFSTNNFDVSTDPQQMWQNWQMAPKINSYLQPLPTGEFYLNVWATYDSFSERSDRWFRIISQEKIDFIKKDSYIKWSKSAEILWLEYSDLECPYCAKHHNSGTIWEVTKKYGEEISIAYNHFPLYFHENAQIGAEILECLWEEKWVDAFYALIEKSYKDEKSAKSFLIAEAINLWADEDVLNKCIDSWKYSEKVRKQMANGTELFSVTWTPGNVLINVETWEYDVISGAYPVESFNELIERLKK